MAHGYSGDKQALLMRLRRAEGQVRGIARMVDEEAYCIDVLTQVSAVTKALESVALTLLEDHLGHCVAEAVGEGGPVAQEKLREHWGPRLPRCFGGLCRFHLHLPTPGVSHTPMLDAYIGTTKRRINGLLPAI